MLLLTGGNLGRGGWGFDSSDMKEEKEVIESTCDAMAYR